MLSHFACVVKVFMCVSFKESLDQSAIISSSVFHKYKSLSEASKP